MRVLILVAVTAVIVEAYVSRNGAVSFTTDVTSYRKLRPRNFLLGPPFVDEMIGQQIPSHSPAVDQTISQQTLQDVPLRDRTVYPFEFPILRHQPFKQNAVRATTFGQPLFRDTLSRNQDARGQRAIVQDDFFVGGRGTSLASDEIFEEQASTYRMPLKEQQFTNVNAEAVFKNWLHEQSLPTKQALFRKQVASAEVPSIFNTVYRDNNEPIDSYGRHKDLMSRGESWTKYGSHEHEMSSMPMLSSSEHLFLSNVDEVDSLEAFKMKLGPMLTSGSSKSSGKCNAPVDSSPTISNGAITTVPSISVSANQSSIVGHILTSLTTKPSSPVTTTATPIAFTGNTIGPTYFHATEYGAVLTSLPAKSELKSNLMPKASKNSITTDIQSSMLNYILSEEYKNGLKSAQNSLTNYALPEGLKQDWSLQQFPQPEASSGYVPLSLNGKTNLIVPSLSVAPISTISWPMETKADVSTMLPAKSVMTFDTSNNLPIGLNLHSDFMESIPNSLTPSISNSISGSITGSISTSIPGSMTPGMPASIPTLSLGQSLHRAEQLQQTQEARNLWYPAGLQLQLGGFGGINYTLHASNPAAMRPMELGMAETGLTPPKLPTQAHEPAFAKIRYHL
ncbi:uncharacterized protein LOC109854206 isoform X2 [Pseudomyrmex gracilis]|uniref:uncharacterized protein LOC109854206 isoform X2 n=1 Tax=Pseudomyrmex gracilis TaxID=219809 RepID=UPI000994EF59|nr:uncharacterized protein LOC109854206 isoform X2 [Pseudomyrmex gracilis]